MKKMMATVFVAALALLANQSALAQSTFVWNPYKNYIKESEKALTSPALQAKLAEILPAEDLVKFNENLVVFTAGSEFKDGTVRYSAIAHIEGNAPFSTIVIRPNNYYYIAYKAKNDGKVVYITNDGYCTKEPHDLIKLSVYSSFTSDKNKRIDILSKPAIVIKTEAHDCSKVYGHPNIKKRFSTDVVYQARNAETEEQQKLREVVNSIWEPSTTSHWNMNEALAHVVGDAVNSITECSRTFTLVPKPAIYTPTKLWKFFLQYASNVVRYNNKLRQNFRYKTCIIGVSAHYRTPAEEAAAGL
ncbi:MAG: hypothetical protein Q4B71_05835 [Cardiobacteriaceae bacterium]|nr:hypothetical protein [Cardiobacteriaceae bacterium]